MVPYRHGSCEKGAPLHSYHRACPQRHRRAAVVGLYGSVYMGGASPPHYPGLVGVVAPRPQSILVPNSSRVAPRGGGCLLAFVRDSPPSRSGPKVPRGGGGHWRGGVQGGARGGGGWEAQSWSVTDTGCPRPGNSSQCSRCCPQSTAMLHPVVKTQPDMYTSIRHAASWKRAHTGSRRQLPSLIA